MVKICHFSSVHRGLDVRIFHKECVTLAAAGYETHLIINVRAPEVAQAESHGVFIHPLPLPSSRLSRMFKHAWRCYRIAKGLNAAIYHFHDPELLPWGLLLKRRGCKVIYDAHEDLPRQVRGKHWIPIPLRRLVSWSSEKVEDFVAHRLDGLIAATPHIAARFSRINQNTVNINNYPLLDELARPLTVPACKKQICYVGGISRVRGIRPLVETLPLVAEVRLVLCGRFSEQDFEAELRILPGWQQVDYRGQVGRNEIRDIMAECFAGMVTFFPIQAHLDALPNKLFEYMSAELPVIASDFPLWRRIMDDTGAGICVNPQSPAQIARAIRKLLDDPKLVERMGKAGRTAVLEKYNWPNEARKLIEFYKRIA